MIHLAIQRFRTGIRAIETAYTSAMLRLVTRAQAGRAGQSTLEWALIALLIAVVAYAAYKFLGGAISSKVSTVGTLVNGS